MRIAIKLGNIRLKRESEQIMPDELSEHELKLCRVWFDIIQDIHPDILGKEDYKLAVKLKQQEGYYISKEEAKKAEIDWEEEYKKYKTK